MPRILLPTKLSPRLPVNKLVSVPLRAVETFRVAPLPAAELSVMVPALALERLNMVLLKPARSRAAPDPTVKALPLLNPVVLPALSVPALMVVAPE